MATNLNSNPKPQRTFQARISGLRRGLLGCFLQEPLIDYGMRKRNDQKKYPLLLFSKPGCSSYCQLCIHYCFPLVPPRQYRPRKIWCGRHLPLTKHVCVGRQCINMGQWCKPRVAHTTKPYRSLKHAQWLLEWPHNPLGHWMCIVCLCVSKLGLFFSTRSPNK